MAHISGFQKFKLMLENNNVNYLKSTVINEKLSDVKSIGSDEPLPGSDLSNYALAKIPGFRDAFTKALTYIKEKYSTDDKVKELVDNWKRLIKKDSRLYPTWLTTGLVSWNDKLGSSYAAMHAAARLCMGQTMNNKKQEFKLFPMAAIGDVYDHVQRNAEKDIIATPAPKNGIGAEIYSTGKVSGKGKSVDDSTEQEVTNYNDTKHYMNSYNIISACYNGDCYGGNDNITENGDLDLNNTASGSIVVFTDTITGERKVSREEKTTTTTEIVGFEPGFEGVVDIAFDQASAKIPKGDVSKIDALVKLILEKFKDKTVDSFELTSSASPEWPPLKTLADYGDKALSGTKATLPNTGDAYSKNANLAYNRGVALMTALNTKLKAAGHAGFPNYVIKWQIADKGGPSKTGRFVDLNIQSNEAKGKKVTTTTKEIVGNVDQKKSTTTGESTFYAYFLM